MTLSSCRRFRVPLALACALILSSCAGSSRPGEEDASGGSLFKKALKKTAVVTTSVVSARDVPLVLTEEGNTEAADRYLAKSPGKIRVQTVFVAEGARVQPGDPLVKFNDETLALRLNVARAEVREAEAGLAAVGTPERAQIRPANGETAENNEDQPEETDAENLDLSEARATLYQAQLERARAEQELFERMVELDQLNSPIAGTVGRVLIGEGSVAVEDQELIEVVKLDPVNFRFRLPVEEVTHLERGSDIVVKFTAFGGQEFPAEVAAVGSESGGARDGGVEVKLRISNPDLQLKTELQGTAEIRTSARRKVVSVPESAIVRTERSAYVYKVESGKATRVAVDLGTTNGGQVEIEKGLSEGDTVIVTSEDGMESLSDGATVEVQPANAGT